MTSKKKSSNPPQNPFKYGWNCEGCGNPTFHVINDGGSVMVLSCVKCGHKKTVSLCSCGSDD